MSQLKILCAFKRVTCSNSILQTHKIFGITAQSLVARASRRLGFVQPWPTC